MVLKFSTFEELTSRVNSLSVALRSGYLSVRTAEGASEKQSSLQARLRNGHTYLLTFPTLYFLSSSKTVSVYNCLCLSYNCLFMANKRTFSITTNLNY